MFQVGLIYSDKNVNSIVINIDTDMVLNPPVGIDVMLKGRTYLYVSECKIKANHGYGITFEIDELYDIINVPTIAAMMDVSITVRETHFTQNSLGNMGKIPSNFMDHEETSSLYAQIKRKNSNAYISTHSPIPVCKDDSNPRLTQELLKEFNTITNEGSHNKINTLKDVLDIMDENYVKNMETDIELGIYISVYTLFIFNPISHILKKNQQIIPN